MKIHTMERDLAAKTLEFKNNTVRKKMNLKLQPISFKKRKKKCSKKRHKKYDDSITR